MRFYRGYNLLEQTVVIVEFCDSGSYQIMREKKFMNGSKKVEKKSKKVEKRRKKVEKNLKMKIEKKRVKFAFFPIFSNPT